MNRVALSGATLLLLLAACGSEPQPVDTTLPTEETANAAAPAGPSNQQEANEQQAVETFPCMGAQCRILTTHGWSGIRAGMTLDQARRASGFRLIRPGHYDEYFSDEPERLEACNIYGLVGAPANLSVFVENGVITSIGVGQEEGTSVRFETDRGVGLGDSEAAVRRAYPRLEQEPDIYSEPPDKKLFYRDPTGHGIKFSIVGGVVTAINVGGSSIRYVEGCL